MRMLNIVRRIDDIGRIAIPKEVRKQLGWNDQDALEFYLDEHNNLVIGKYNPKGYEETKDKTNIDFMLKYIDNLEEENKRLKKINTDTYKMKVAVGTREPYYIDTQIVLPKDNLYYYIPTDYKNPTKVRLIAYNNYQSVDNCIRIMAFVSINKKTNLTISPDLLFYSAEKAGDYYLEHKEELDWNISNSNEI